MKNINIILFLLLITSIYSCKKEIDNTEIRYEIKLLTNSRPLAIIYQTNEYGTYDTIRNYNKILYTSTKIIPSDKTPSDYYIFAHCNKVNSINQIITVRIFEDELLVAEKIIAGTETINLNVAYVVFKLPTRIKYKD